MKVALNSVFAYPGPRSTVMVGHLHVGFVGKRLVLVDFSERLQVDMANMPKKKKSHINHNGQIDTSKIYGGYYQESVALATFNPQKITIKADLLEKPIGTYVGLVTPADAQGDLDIRTGEVAVIIVGENADQLYRLLNLKAKRLRHFETADQGRGQAKRRMRYFGLTEHNGGDVGFRPTSDIAEQQMFASEGMRRFPDQMI